MFVERCSVSKELTDSTALLQAFASSWKKEMFFPSLPAYAGPECSTRPAAVRGVRSPCRCLVSLPPLLLFVLQPSTSVTLPHYSSAFQSAKGKEGTASCKDGKSHFSGLVTGESSSLQQRQKRLQEHGKERRELLSKGTFQVLGSTARLESEGLIFP